MELEIQYTDSLIGTPAAVSREGGVIYINPDLFAELTDFEQRFVLLHEEGHYVLDSADEVECDAYAFDRMAGTEWQSLKQMIGTLDKLLKDGNVSRAERLFALYKRALRWDAANGNADAAKEYKKIANRNALDGVSKCGGWWIFRSCTSDPTGDKQAAADTQYTKVQSYNQLLSSIALFKANNLAMQQKAADAANNNKLVMAAIAALVLIVFLMD